MIDRRMFLGTGLAGLSLSMMPFGLAIAGRPLKLLILGGTGFLGPHTVRAAVARGHDMTLFNRGRTNTHLFPELEKLRGDRDGDLEALKGRTWDAVIDTSGYVPRLVRDSARLLSPNVGQYVFISSISVYADFKTRGMDETAAVGTLDDTTVEDVTGTTYGPLKALCETAARQEFDGRAAIIRPGLIGGPGDRTDRFTYWPVRVARGGDVLAPGAPEAFTQFIDVRDLASFIVRAVEDGLTDTYNADRPAESLTMASMLDACREASQSDARFHWASASWLETHGVKPWSDMPAWFPDEGDFANLGEISSDKAAAAGLTIRPVVETARDTLNWFRSLPGERQADLKSGLKADREAELVKALMSDNS